MEQPKYEYKVVNLESYNLQGLLNELGEKGYVIQPIYGNCKKCILMRKKQ